MTKLFAHRGFVTKSNLENSLASLTEAIKNNFKAIEFDLWFLEKKLVLKHDKPKNSEIKFLPQFSEYLTYKNDLTYWLDFKNLDEENCFTALMIAKKEIELANIKLEQVYFAPFILDLVKAEKIFIAIRTIFGSQANLVGVCENLKNSDELQKLKQFLNQNHVKFLSIFHQLLNKNLVEFLSNIEIFAWTINDLERLRELEALGVKNFATDKITPQIYENRNSTRSS